MAKLYFRYGAMGSSKSANALMVEYNYYDRGKKALLVKPCIDNRDGERVIKSRCGLSHSCIYVEELVEMSDEMLGQYDCIIVDEAQFCKKSDVEFFIHIVDELGIPVICYGLRTDFKRVLFEGSKWLLAWADVIEEIRTVCWCGQGASCNARISEDGSVIRDGAQVVLGGNESYVALCRKHYKEGNVGNAWRIEHGKYERERSTLEDDIIREIVASKAKERISEEEDFDDDDEMISTSLIAFLDAETYEEKTGIFNRMIPELDDDMINAIAMSLDIEVAKGSLDRRIEDVLNCLSTLSKYECNRLR